MEFGKSDWRTFERGTEKEWLLANGIGGFASSTIIGANTRRYHGLLVASLKPPVQRHLILSKLDESLIVSGKTYNLYSFKTSDYEMKGYYHLSRVIVDPLPVFEYGVRDVLIEKKISMVYGENTVAIVYHILNGAENIKLRLTPLVNFRDYHSNSNRAHMDFVKSVSGRTVFINPYHLDIDISLFCSEGIFVSQEDNWFLNMYYPVEQERGLHPFEDHCIPGYFEIEAAPWEDKLVTVVATVEKEPKSTDGLSIIREEEGRINSLLQKSGYNDTFALELVAAADKFIVYRKSTDAKTVIAGYPWFTDWGRDTMIAFTGLTLATKRFEDAKQILLTFSRYVRDGLIPNMFPDEGQEPLYNTVDAALWYFEAVGKFIEYTGEYDYVEDNIYSTLKEIAGFYMKGTKFNIRMDDDYLITAGDSRTQLTWMDAKIDDWVVTPRHGKAVEINALWYNALKVMAKLAGRFDGDARVFEDTAEKVKQSFVKSFWNEDGQYLYDVITGNFKDDRVRPNQILAVSLSNAVIEGEMAQKVVDRVWSELYTSYGLRSLSPDEEGYIGVYAGDRHRRDAAYHQGTVWVWPIGHFISAFMKVYGNTDENREKARKLIYPLYNHLGDACIGSISEIFDGNDPLIPRGCFAQAWSVGEVLRAYAEDILYAGTNFKHRSQICPAQV